MSKRGEALVEKKMSAHLYLPFFRHLGSLLYHSTSLLLVTDSLLAQLLFVNGVDLLSIAFGISTKPRPLGVGMGIGYAGDIVESFS